MVGEEFQHSLSRCKLNLYDYGLVKVKCLLTLFVILVSPVYRSLIPHHSNVFQVISTLMTCESLLFEKEKAN